LLVAVAVVWVDDVEWTGYLSSTTTKIRMWAKKAASFAANRVKTYPHMHACYYMALPFSVYKLDDPITGIVCAPMVPPSTCKRRPVHHDPAGLLK
jgi:hypothetical protein